MSMTQIEMEEFRNRIGWIETMRYAMLERPVPDWEQRRYEIARDVYPMACHDMNPSAPKDAPAKAAVELADILIAELKNEPTR